MPVMVVMRVRVIHDLVLLISADAPTLQILHLTLRSRRDIQHTHHAALCVLQDVAMDIRTAHRKHGRR